MKLFHLDAFYALGIYGKTKGSPQIPWTQAAADAAADAAVRAQVLAAVRARTALIANETAVGLEVVGDDDEELEVEENEEEEEKEETGVKGAGANPGRGSGPGGPDGSGSARPAGVHRSRAQAGPSVAA